jgi:PIN domain nuclease of toxin-antitoxin system
MKPPGLLLDTNVLLWLLLGEKRKISRRALKALSTPGARLAVSVVSIWEILLKRQAGKLWTSEAPDAIVTLIRSQQAWRILPLDVTQLHALTDVAAFTDHTNPFDRLLIAQARGEGFGVVTDDPHFSRYGVEIVW